MKEDGNVGSRQIIINTPNGEIEVTGKSHNQPGICPHCQKFIPLSSVLFKKINSSGESFMNGVKAAEVNGIIFKPSMNSEGSIGVCPYCHEAIPMNKIIFKEGERN
jgi:hypothetical protein